MREEIFSLAGVSCSYGGAASLCDISLSIRSGEAVAIVGANGSGKTTLLKLLDGLVFPASGEMRALGRGLTEDALRGGFLRYFRERVGFLFHEPDAGLFSPTVTDELLFGPLQLDIPEHEARARAEDLLSMLGIGALRHRAPYTLSTGEKKKVAIAAMLSTNPDVLLLDEPTNGLDPRTQVWLMELIQGLKGRGKTLVVATHDLSLVEDIGERVVLLDESHRVAADGRAPDILRDKALLLRTNIIHEHAHRHGDAVHTHSHGPYSGHDEHD